LHRIRLQDEQMKYWRFEPLGDNYPHALENRFDRILGRIDALWDKAEIGDYFTDLIIDKRGGRQGFPKAVLDEILMLRDFREAETLRITREKELALRQLRQQGLSADRGQLLVAVESGDQSLVDLFLKAGVSVDIVDEHGTPALMLAMNKGYSIIANMLVVAGADVNATDKIGVAPLLLACARNSQGFSTVARQLVKRGANVNVRDLLGYTPLLLALSGGTVEVAPLLIERGADVNVRTRNGETPFALARRAGRRDIAELLFTKGAMP
jgi:tankyrase